MTLVETHPKNLSIGDSVVVKQVHPDKEVRGIVDDVVPQAGRYCVAIDDGEPGGVVTCWERQGRTFYREEDQLELRALGLDVEIDEARELADAVYELIEERGHDVDGVAPVLREVDR